MFEKAAMSGAAINDLPDSAFAYIEPGGSKDAEGKTVPRSLRHFPIHDEAHVRNALARAPQSPFGEKAMPAIRAAAKRMDIEVAEESAGKSLMPLELEDLSENQLADWLAGKRPRELVAIPFGGPIPSADGKGRDLDNEYFDHDTDIKPDWFSERPVDWHHSKDPTGYTTGHLFGKATDLREEPEGWMVNLWLRAGESRLALVKRIIEQGGQIFGSSWAYPNLIKRGKAGHIDVWPYTIQTLSTSPQNIWSALRPAKAADLFDLSGIALDDRLHGLLSSLDSLGPSLDPSSAATSGEDWAKAGRVISSRNEQALQDAIDSIQAVLDSMRQRSSAPSQEN